MRDNYKFLYLLVHTQEVTENRGSWGGVRQGFLGEGGADSV